jgi:hypothetical protein
MLAGAIIVAAMISFFPVAVLNTHFTGDYSGDPHNVSQQKLDSPISGLLGNSIQVVVANVWPPLWPTKTPLNALIPEPLRNYFARTFPRFDPSASTGEMQMEESAGLGLGITICLISMIVLRCWAGVARPDLVMSPKRQFLPIFLGTIVALVVFMAKFGNEGVQRYLTPYYPLLIAGVLLLLALDGAVIRFFLCRVIACGVMFMAVPLVILSPQRPLFSTETAAHYLAKISPTGAARMQKVYEVYGARYDSMKELTSALPINATSVGLIQTGDISESVLWRPYGSRRIVDVAPTESIDQLKADHVHYIIVDDEALNETYHTTFDQVTNRWGAIVVMQKDLVLWAKSGPGSWHIIALP